MSASSFTARLAPSYSVLRVSAVVMVVLQCLIAVTGAVVRVTSSGLGCPTWPRCVLGSLVPTSSPTLDPIHAWIEFSNRMLSTVVGIASVIVLLLALLSRPRRKRQVRLALAMLLLVGLEGLIGGLTVLTKLPWWAVCIHFLVSPLLVWIAVLHLRAVNEGDQPARWLLPRPLRGLMIMLSAVFATLLAAGTLVTAAGPHSGDINTPRLQLPIPALAQLHGDLLVLFFGMLVALGFTLRVVTATATLWRRYWLLIVLSLAQGIIGIVQYLTDVPEVLVMVHVAGATIVTVCTAALWCAGRDRGPRPVPAVVAEQRDPVAANVKE